MFVCVRVSLCVGGVCVGVYGCVWVCVCGNKRKVFARLESQTEAPKDWLTKSYEEPLVVFCWLHPLHERAKSVFWLTDVGSLGRR